MDSRVMSLRAQRWREIISACNTSGMKKIDWMRIHNVSSKNFYRWQKLLRDHALEEDYGYPIVPDHITLSSKSQDQSSGTQFVDMTAMITRETETVRKSASESVVPKQITPELVIQAGRYNLYISSGITETTLTTVLKVIGNA